jgi:hypothetical protein
MNSVGERNCCCLGRQQARIQAWIYKIFTLGWVLVLLVKQKGGFRIRGLSSLYELNAIELMLMLVAKRVL